MPYNFKFDLTKLPEKVLKRTFQAISKKAIELAREKQFTEKVKYYACNIAEKLKLDEITGLPISNGIELMVDLIETEIKNLEYKERFNGSKKRALILPHCARKYMDSRCKADFNALIPTYSCNHCSEDCLVNKAVELGERKGYDVYIIPGGSCVQDILKKGRYDGVVGVACPPEIELADKLLRELNIAGQAVPLMKNGCSGTKFDLNRLEEIL